MKKYLALALVLAAVAAAFAVPALAATHKVKVGDNFFVKSGGATVTVTKGTTVNWIWRGSAPHNVTVTKGPTKFRSKTQSSGHFSRKLTKAGTYKIVCTIHAPGMRMTLKVK
jgi:plastocyanin